MLVFHGLNNQAEASRSHPELITITQIKSTVLGAVLSHSVVSDSCDPVDCSRRAPLSMGFSRQEYWSGLPCPPPGDLPNPGTEPRSPGLQADSLPSEPPGKPKNPGVGGLSGGSSRPRNRTGVSWIAGGFLSWATREAPSSASYPAIPIPAQTQRPRNCCVRRSGRCGNPQLLDHPTAGKSWKAPDLG